MPPRLKKLIGTVLLVAFISLYALTAMTIAAAKLPGSSGLAQLVFFLVAGTIWILPAAALVAWMQKPGNTGS
jgi:hypothetical protein